MNDAFDVSDDLKLFTGHAPLFPLPNVVQLPHTWLPLHIFEPRYRQMVAEALEGDRLIAMALLRPDGVAEYESKFAAVSPIVCLGRIVIEERLPNGKFNLVLRGLCRAHIDLELSDDRPYRTAELTLRPDWYPTVATIDRSHRHRELLAGAIELLPELRSDPLRHQLLDAELPLGVLCDVLAQALGLPPADAQLLLEEHDVDLRSDLVLTHLRQRQRRQSAMDRRGFPPTFSRN